MLEKACCSSKLSHLLHVEKRPQYKNSKLKIIAPMWNDEVELSDDSYSVSDIQDYIQYVIKKHKTLPTNSAVHIFTLKGFIID